MDVKPNIPRNAAGDDEDAPVDKKPNLKDKITITIEYEGQSVQIATKPTSTFEKVFQAAAKRWNVDPKTFLFRYEGTRVRPEDTPAGLDMADGDELQAFVHQIGG